MYRRITEHVEATKQGFPHKYKILKQAIQQGHKVQFDVLYYAKAKNPYIELLRIEAYYINKLKPLLNVQIPDKKDYTKTTINEYARSITLEEILKGEK